MSFVDMYRNQVGGLQRDLAALQRDKSRLAEDRARAAQRACDAQRSMSSTHSISTLQSKARELERYNQDAARLDDRIADVERKIAQKHTDLSRAQDQLAREEQREFERQQREQKRLAQEHERRMRQQQADAQRATAESDRRFRDVATHLHTHDQLHAATIVSIEKLQRLPEEITVLFVAANPIDQDQLRLDEEIRAIEQKIRLSEHRDSVKLVAKWAVRPTDLLQALNECKPHIVHFSGHGSERDEIVFQDDVGSSKFVTKDAIGQLMKVMADNIRLVIFNACHSKGTAQSVTEHIDAAIGMNDAIGDEAARIFAAQFYSAIGFGRSVEEAFRQATSLLILEDMDADKTPELFTRSGLDPKELVLVKP